MSEEEIMQFLKLDNYSKQEQISVGGYGTIYKVLNVKDRKIYAAKISNNCITNDQQSINNLYIKREVNNLAQMNHPYVVKFIGYSPINFEGYNFPVIITEFVPNGSLKEIISGEQKKLHHLQWTPTKKLINIFGIASIMSFIHANNIIHRDLNPKNILLDEHLFPKIADFGLSKNIFTENNSEPTSKGTVKYIAPESFSDYLYFKSSDVYAFAIIVYEMMTNEEPYLGWNLPQIVASVIKGERPSLIKDSLPECYRKLIQDCWSHEPDSRPTFSQIVERIKSDDFDKSGVDMDEFNQYVDLIENADKNFDPSKKFKTFTLRNNDRVPREENEARPNDPSLYEKLKKNQAFSNLKKDTKNFFENSLKNKIENYFTIKNEIAKKIDEEEGLKSDNLTTVLSMFSEVIFELNADDEKFTQIFDNLSNSGMKNIKICILISDNSNVKDLIQITEIPISIEIKDGVQTIEESAFAKCKSLYKIKIPASMKTIGKKSFFGCGSLREIEIPVNVEEMEESAFERCFLLEKVEIKSSKIKEIKDKTFNNCQSLKKISLPSSVECIGCNTFEMCFNLEKIEFDPKKIKKIGQFAFNGCQSLKDFIIPFNLTNIETNTFFDCSSLTQITIPSSVKTIEFGSFCSCVLLKQINFEENSKLKTIINGAFSACSSLENIIIPKSVQQVGGFAFSGCLKLETISIPSIKEIKDWLFDGCIKLQSFTIPEKVTSINDGAFSKCCSLIEINIPSSVKIIKKSAFYGCETLKSLSIPKSVNSIEKNAFQNCTKLENIVFEDSIEIEKINEGLFNGCESLKFLSIPESVTEIGNNVFEGCKSLEEIKLPEKLKSIGECAFNLCTNLLSIKIPKSTKTIGENAFLNCNDWLEVQISKEFSEEIDRIGLNRQLNIQFF